MFCTCDVVAPPSHTRFKGFHAHTHKSARKSHICENRDRFAHFSTHAIARPMSHGQRPRLRVDPNTTLIAVQALIECLALVVVQRGQSYLRIVEPRILLPHVFVHVQLTATTCASWHIVMCAAESDQSVWLRACKVMIQLATCVDC